jgi:peptide/nickel transport system substrate-binding protein
MAEQGESWRAYDALKAGQITRRAFVQRATALGVGLPVVLDALRAPGAQAQAVAQAEPTRGGSVTVALSSEPTTVNEYFSTRSADGWVAQLVIESLLRVDPEGNYAPELAADVPTQENGGVSADGLVVTYRLRDGVTWSDGEPFTSADVRFTYDMVMNDANPVASRSTYELIAAVETPDPLTVVVTWREFLASHLGVFSAGILPSHVFGGNTDISRADFDRNPVGTGPFVVSSWEAATAIIFERNENYREEGKPYLDQIIFPIVPSPDVATEQLLAGEVDVVINLREDQIALLQRENNPNAQLLASPSPSVERVHFNLAAPGTPADPAVPHPVLGDLRVRQALELATPRQQIVEQLIGGGMATVTGSTLPLGWAAADPPIPPTEYDPERAAQLLDEAGWISGDGVRQKDGQPLRLRIVSTPEQLRTLVLQVLAERWGELGIEVEVSNQQSAVLLGSWEENGTRDIGDFDSMVFASSAGVDPHEHYRTRYHSDAIPTAANNGEGRNTNRLADPVLDELIVAAGSTADQTERKALYRQVNEQLNSGVANIWLYARSGVDAHSPRVGGLLPQPWGAVTFNSQDWFVTD